MVIFLLTMLVRLFLKLNEKMEELARYKGVGKTVREAAHLQRDEDPFVCELDSNHPQDEEAEKNISM